MRASSILLLVVVLGLVGCSSREATPLDGGVDAVTDGPLPLDSAPDGPGQGDGSLWDLPGQRDRGKADQKITQPDLKSHDGKPIDLGAWPDYGPVPDGAMAACTSAKSPTSGTTGAVGKADILFVVDNTVMMDSAQTALVSAMSGLETQLEAGVTPSYRIGVVSTDLGAGPYVYTGCDVCGHDGKLQTQPFLSSCQAPASKYIENASGTKNYTGTMANTFKCLASVGSSGCGFEQPLQSAATFLTNANAMIRQDASLVIVVFTNEDDCSAKNLSLYDLSNLSWGNPDSFRCFQHGVTCDINDPNVTGPRQNCTPKIGGPLHEVSAYVTLFKALKPANRVAVVVIAGSDTPVSLSAPRTLATSCSSTQTDGWPSIRLKALADAFGTKGKFHSICGSLAQAMTDIATFAKTM